ncbi:hypothetical protein BC829DRAFT_382001 [Chytridium lagenaria]|nr:hypothetical protein BC829DRAFT_382001 [Chytridium lagenaria]
MIDVFTGVYDMVDRRLSAMEKKRKLEFTKQKGGPMVDETQRHNRRSLHRRKEDAVIPAESSLGWKLDAHKNLPGFEYLYKTYPDADWYIMIDDDSYVFFDNLERYLRDMDPAVPFYTGSANVFLGWFAHGGSGIVVSRGAMKLMMEGIEKCIKKYKDCWAGDVRVALCLRDQNLLITPGYQFPANGCERPNVFHHLLPYQIQRLYEIELTSLSTHPDQGTTMSDIHNTFNPSTHNTPSLNTDRTGNDFDDGPASSVAICEGRCFAHVRCVSWAYNGERCWMKDGLGVKIEKEGIVSGVIADRYSCKK